MGDAHNLKRKVLKINAQGLPIKDYLREQREERRNKSKKPAVETTVDKTFQKEIDSQKLSKRVKVNIANVAIQIEKRERLQKEQRMEDGNLILE